MRIPLTLFLAVLLAATATAKPRTVHVFVALCDNEHQGIVPVPKALGNGRDLNGNLYWGAAYGVRSWFKRSADWKLVGSVPADDPAVLERLLFKHAKADVYLLADAYDGARIRSCVQDFLLAANGQQAVPVTQEGTALSFGGGADLVAYVGHDGLMDFAVAPAYGAPPAAPRDAIVLACYSKHFFGPQLQQAGATPLLWTTHLMAPEAYTLTAALSGWVAREPATAVRERAAQAYNTYQKCGINGARKLLVTGY
ncbi:MAG: hypothetical protein H6595_06765 [Flavobacteriales bacterium]|nr:hypothetical protein [Flavobacteriales bacterium]MCB9167168.1 hypothetical protein [Flavobacteriales bacterium]